MTTSTDIAWIDFETTSQANLIKHGLQRYVEDETTEVLCLGWAINDGDVNCWFPEDGFFPLALSQHIEDGGAIYAHNATFDRLIWEYVLSNDFLVVTPKLNQWRCSMARAMMHGLPAALGNVCRAMALPLQKQAEGKRLIQDYSIRGRVPWLADDKQLMADYCMTDIKTMRQFCSVLRELSDQEWAEYHLNEQTNEFGIPVDVAFATAALDYATDVKADVDGEVLKLTEGQVISPRARKTRDAWLFDIITDKQKELLSVHKDGVKKYSLDQEHRDNLLAAPDLDIRAERLINLMNDAGGSSTSKYNSIANTHVEGRVHNALVWHGAATGRWTSKGLQVHNMPRKAFDDPEPLVQDVLNDYEIDKPASTLSRLLRATITAPGGITFGDWSQIEARVLPWLTLDQRADKVLEVFLNGVDIYMATAESMGLTDRQAGKVASLSLGFAGGAKALQRMGKAYGTVYSDEEAENLKTLWRTANRWCVEFWYNTLQAATNAHKLPGVEFKAGRATFLFDGCDWLWMRRPSGCYHAYFQPRMEMVEYPWGGEGYELTSLAGSVKPKAGAPWPRRVLTAGTLVENLTQGTARDVLAEALMLAKDLPVIAHVHDEIVVEGDYRQEVSDIMNTVPVWAEGLPLKAEVKHQQRYGK